MNWLVALTEPAWLKIVAALVFGYTLGLWTDAFLRRREPRYQVAQPTLGPPAEAGNPAVNLANTKSLRA